uniref:Claudin 23.2 n=1 Tax=Oryzias sinensis TaxID=183150 RepID=A0A8C8DTS7_9TELE
MQRTPGILIFGMVMAPCGWILDLTATVAPNWRTLHQLPNRPTDAVMQQGIWDICLVTETSSSATSTNRPCGQADSTYFGNQIIGIAQGMMVASLIVTLIGLAVAIPGVRCWRENPNWLVAGLAGLLIFCSGVLTIIPIAWYNHIFKNLTSVTTSTDIRVGYSIVLGYIGGIFEVLGGIVMFIGICRCCGGKNRGERRLKDVVPRPNRRSDQQSEPERRVDVPRLSRPRSTSPSSVAYTNSFLVCNGSLPENAVSLLLNTSEALLTSC